MRRNLHAKYLLAMVAGIVFLAPVAAHAEQPIYLTFDMDMDGSMYQKALTTEKEWYDPSLFSYLEQNHIQATFFISGLFALAYPDLMQKLASTTEFSFQNHSYDESSFVPHCYWLATLGTDAAKTSQITETENIIKQTTGQTATYFRFPGTCRDAKDVALVKSLGYTINDGSVISGDPFNKNAPAIVKAVLANATSSATILMHVGGPNAPESLAALEQIVPKLEARGYEFEKL